MQFPKTKRMLNAPMCLSYLLLGEKLSIRLLISCLIQYVKYTKLILILFGVCFTNNFCYSSKSMEFTIDISNRCDTRLVHFDQTKSNVYFRILFEFYVFINFTSIQSNRLQIPKREIYNSRILRKFRKPNLFRHRIKIQLKPT